MAIFNSPTGLVYVTDLINLANTYMGGYLGLFILILVGFGSLFITSNFNSKESVIASAFITMILSFFLKYMGLLQDFFLFVGVAYFVIALIIGGTRGTSGG